MNYSLLHVLLPLGLLAPLAAMTASDVRADIQHYWNWRALWAPTESPLPNVFRFENHRAISFWGDPLFGYCLDKLGICELFLKRKAGTIVPLKSARLAENVSQEENARRFLSSIPLAGLTTELTTEQLLKLLATVSATESGRNASPEVVNQLEGTLRIGSKGQIQQGGISSAALEVNLRAFSFSEVRLQGPNPTEAVQTKPSEQDINQIISAAHTSITEQDRNPGACLAEMLVPHFDVRDPSVFVVVERSDCTSRLLVIGRESTSDWQLEGESPSQENAAEMAKRIRSDLLTARPLGKPGK